MDKRLGKIQTLAILPGNAISDLEMAKPSEILASTTDSEAWNIEVERVAPKLKVTVRVDGRDWRSHLEQVSWPTN
jgi:estrogen-related receptor beta like 1